MMRLIDSTTLVILGLDVKFLRASLFSVNVLSKHKLIRISFKTKFPFNKKNIVVTSSRHQGSRQDLNGHDSREYPLPFESIAAFWWESCRRLGKNPNWNHTPFCHASLQSWDHRSLASRQHTHVNSASLPNAHAAMLAHKIYGKGAPNPSLLSTSDCSVTSYSYLYAVYIWSF